MNNLASQIRQISNEAKEMFLKRTDRLFQERVEKEHSLAKQYCGREILELLQNIDDAYNPDCGKPCVAEFALENGCLTVSNYGNPFTIETLQRLCQGSVSSKEGKYIGSKGIGFRSILNWSDKVEIYSHAQNSDYIAVRFSKDDADSIFDQIRGNDHIRSQVNELQRKGIDSSFPIFKAPVPIEPIDNLEYNTVIKIYIKEDDGDVESIVQREIEEFDKNTMLFLPNIQTVEFHLDDKVLKYGKTKKENNRVGITFNGGTPVEYFYFEDNEQTIERSIKGSNKIKIAVAIPCVETDSTYHLYSFFPILNIPSPFNALLHATFSLNANRNNLESSPEDDNVNQEVFKKLIDFYVKKVTSLDLRERVIKLLSPISFGTNFKFPSDLARLNIENYYFNKCREADIFYTINNNYLRASAASTPFILEDIPSAILEYDSIFSRLVKIDNLSRLFAQEILSGRDSKIEDYLIDVIDDNSLTWPSHNRVQIFKWWISNHYSGCPRLIKDTRGNFIESSINACFISGSDTDTINDVPDWAVICIINKEDEQELISQYKDEIQEYRENNKASERDARILPRLLDKNYIKLQEQSSKQVMISPVNNSIDGDFPRAVEFLKWLWRIWIIKGTFSSSVLEDIDFFVPTTKHVVRKARETFIGKELDNDLGARLFSATSDSYDEIYKIPDIQDDIKYSIFLRELGVNKYPAIFNYDKKVNDWDKTIINHYIAFVKTIHPLDVPENVSGWEAHVSSVKELELILNKIGTEDIVKWIWNDDQLKRSILIGEEPESSYIEYKPRKQGQLYYWRWNKGWNLPSYLGFVFSTTPWITIGEYRYAPNQLMISSESQIDYCDDILCISDTVIEEIAQKANISYDDLKQLLKKLGVKESYLDLDSTRFYKLLYNLGNNDCEKSRKISREIYRAIIDNNRGSSCAKSSFFSPSKNKDLFFQNGKILAKNRSGKIAYRQSDQVYFSSSAVINLDDSYFIDVPPRSGSRESFEQILGIKPYTQKYSVVNKELSPLDEDFQNDFISFLPYLLAYRTGKKSTNSLSIHLVSSISILINDNLQDVDIPYSLFRESKSKWFIYVGKNNPSYGSLNKCKIGESLEQIFNVYYNYPSKDFLAQVTRLYICNKDQRQYFVESELGSTYEYDIALKDIQHSEDLKQDLIKGLSISDNENLISLIDSIDWSDLQNEAVQERIVTLIKETSCSLEELCRLLNKTITVSNYNKSSLEKAYLAAEGRIKTDIYHSCKLKKNYTHLVIMWDALQNLVEKYENNDINFDASKQLDLIVKEFYTEHDITVGETSELSDILKSYECRKNEAIRIVHEGGLDLNDFTNDSKNESLLYFAESNWKAEIELFIETGQREKHETATIVNTNNTLQDIIESIIVEDVPEPGEYRIKQISNYNRGGVTETNKRKKESENKKRGNQAEYYVILALAGRKIKEVNDYFNQKEYSIIWKSSAANNIIKAEGDIYQYDTSQINDGAGYDIELVEKENQEKKLYIEVKSSISRNCSFFMSKNEYDAAEMLESSSSEYRVVFVSEESDGRHIFFVDAPVKEVFETLPTEYNVVFNKAKYNLKFRHD